MAPAGWSIEAHEAHLLLEGPEPGLRIAVVDGRGASVEEVVKRAWRVLDPGFARSPGLVTRGTARHGWDERRSFTYETSPNERRVLLAQAHRRGEAWTVVLVGWRGRGSRRVAGTRWR